MRIEARESHGEEEVIVRVFLPYSDLHWLNPERIANLQQAFMKGIIPADEDDEDWEAKDKKGNLMPGNITGKVYEAVEQYLPLARLDDIRQLSLLTFASEGEKNLFYPGGDDFYHTRRLHSLLTARVLELILRANGFSEQKINLGIMGGLTHDLAMPAYGDPTKEIDPEALSEEVALERLLGRDDTAALKTLGFEKEKVLTMVKKEGLLGQLLDVADKIVYTSVDVYHYVFNPAISLETYSPKARFLQMWRIIQQDQKWANIYQEVRVTGEIPYFKNPRRLGRFLELRAQMHRALYLNPHCRGRDMIYKMLLNPLYHREPHPDFPFNADNLTIYTDEEVERIIKQHLGIGQEDTSLRFILGLLPDYKIVADSSLIPNVVKELEEQGLLPIGAETIKKFNPDIDFLTVDPEDAKIKPYRKVFPQHAQLLRQIVNECSQTVIYYWPPDSLVEKTWGRNLKPVVTQLVKQARERNGGNIPHSQLY